MLKYDFGIERRWLIILRTCRIFGLDLPTFLEETLEKGVLLMKNWKMPFLIS
jgi:hypothetical protein